LLSGEPIAKDSSAYQQAKQPDDGEGRNTEQVVARVSYPGEREQEDEPKDHEQQSKQPSPDSLNHGRIGRAFPKECVDGASIPDCVREDDVALPRRGVLDKLIDFSMGVTHLETYSVEDPGSDILTPMMGLIAAALVLF
jgi:hypothetical protein